MGLRCHFHLFPITLYIVCGAPAQGLILFSSATVVQCGGGRGLRGGGLDVRVEGGAATSVQVEMWREGYSNQGEQHVQSVQGPDSSWQRTEAWNRWAVGRGLEV